MRFVAALVIAVIAGGAHTQDVRAQGAPVAFIAVSGEGHANVAPDYAEFAAEVITRGDSLDAATQKHGERAAKAAKVLRGLEKHGLTVMRSSFRLEQAGQKAPTYRAITTFALKANHIGLLNEVVSAIAGAALFEVRAIRYAIKDEERVIDDARRAAVKNARRQAEIYADAAGVKLGEILEITDGSAQHLGSEAALRLTGPSIQLSPPATIPFRAAITIKWRILSR